MSKHHVFHSRHGINERVLMSFVVGDLKVPGVIVGVRFSESKVTYDIDLDEGGETMRNIDSIYVEPVKKAA